MIDSLIEGQKEAIWPFNASETPRFGVAGSGGVGEGVTQSGFDHAPMERTKTVSFVGSLSRSPFSETSSRPVGTSGCASSLTSMSSSVRGGDGRLMVSEAGGVTVVSEAEGVSVVSEAGGSIVTDAGGKSVVAGGGAMVAEGTSASDSSTDKSGNVGDTGFGFADHRPRYGQRGSGREACYRSDLRPVTTSEDFGPISVLLDSSLSASMEVEEVEEEAIEGERSVS